MAYLSGKLSLSYARAENLLEIGILPMHDGGGEVNLLAHFLWPECGK